MTVSRRHVMKWMVYAVTLVAFAYGTYKMHVVPGRATRLDFWLVMGSIVAAGILTLVEQLRARRERRNQRCSIP